MKLYDRQGTPNAARIRIVLAEKELDNQVEFATVNLVAAEQKQDWFIAMNPVGKTPVLVLDDGLVLSECTAITEYLDNCDGKPVLTGTTPREKAIIHMTQRRVEIMVLDPVDDYFHYGTTGLGPALKPWRMPGWDGRKEWGERRGALALQNFPWFNDVLGKQPFLAGEVFSMADITLYAAVAFATGTGLHLADELNELWNWLERISQLPAVKNRSGQNFLPEDLVPREEGMPH